MAKTPEPYTDYQVTDNDPIFCTAERPAFRRGLERVMQDRQVTSDSGEFRKVLPEALLSNILDSIVATYRDDFIACGNDFMKVRYQIGRWGDPWEYYSDPHTLDMNNWQIVKMELAEHVDEFDSKLQTIISESPVKITFFHDKKVFLPPGVEPEPDVLGRKVKDPTALLRGTSDFAIYLQMTTGEFVHYTKTCQMPSEFVIGFDMTYFGAVVTQYVKPWENLLENMTSIARIVGRRFSTGDAALALIQRHMDKDLHAFLIPTGFDISYAPSLQISFSGGRTIVDYSYDGNPPQDVAIISASARPEYTVLQKKKGFTLVKEW